MITAALEKIIIERQRQELLRMQGKFSWTCASPTVPNSDKLAVLAEEFGEVAREVTEALIDVKRYNSEHLVKELVQVAAVCVAWLEALEQSHVITAPEDVHYQIVVDKGPRPRPESGAKEIIDTFNKFGVGVMADRIVFLWPVPGQLERADALLLAAFLVSLAEQDNEFQEILKAVQNA